MTDSIKIPIVNINLKKDENGVEILFLGDLHLGHESFAKEEFEKTINYIKSHSNLYVIGMGDFLEISVEGHIPGSMYSQEITPNKQRLKMMEYLKPFKQRILGVIDGNHEISRGWNLNSISPMEIISENLGVPYWKDGGYAVINLKRNNKVVKTYKLVLFHGCGESTSQDYLVDKIIKIYSDADAVAIGHTHILGTSSKYRVGIKDGKECQRKIIAIRTGSYLKSARYARLKFYPPGAIGSPIMRLSGTTKDVSVRFLEY